jgi:CelD/BcsL family acetyltransferase involved in cellulose biosynthesis
MMDTASPSPLPVEAETPDSVDFSALRPFWRDLARAALEPNPFLESGFAIPALAHLDPPPNLRLVFVWEGTPRASALLALCPVELPEPGSSALARNWLHRQAVLGTPLLAASRAAETLEALLGWIAAKTGAKRLLISKIPTDGPLFALLRQSQTIVAHFDRHERAVLLGPTEPDAYLARALTPKKRKELRRQRRRLDEAANLAFQSYTQPEAIVPAFERFLALEKSGWKGQAGTALDSEPQRGAFAREMMGEAAAAGLCRIDALESPHGPIAMGVLLRSGAHTFYWKTAYDSHFAAFSPGVQLALEMSRRQLVDPETRLTDSCAIPNHPMIDHIWRDRRQVCDIALRCTATPDIADERLFVISERLRRGARAAAKWVYLNAQRLR